MKILKLILPIILFSLATGNVSAAKKAGIIAGSAGTVRASSPDRPSRLLRRGDPVYARDRISTGRRSRVNIRFTDGSRFDLGPRARINVDKYALGDDPKEPPSFTTKILRGAFRFFSGLIAKKKPRSMSVGLSVATIGIRGTHVAGEVTETSAKIVLMEPEENRPTSVEVFNQYGSVTIEEPGFGTEIPDEHSPPSPVRRMKLRTINNVMRSLQSIQRTRPRVGGLH